MTNVKQKIGTMKELSEVIGFSRPTLSRYFQNPDSVRPATSQKIKERLEGVDYVYNFIATRQNRKSSGLVGVIIPYYNDLFFTSLLAAIEHAAHAAGYTVITQSSDGDAEGEIQAVARLRSMNADGAIIAPLGLTSSTESFRMARVDFPIVFVDSRPAEEIQGTDFVGTNNAESIASIVEYLCRTGDEPVYLGMPKMNSNAIERERAYIDKMGKLGLEARIVDTSGTPDSWEFEAYGLSVMDTHFSQQMHVSSTILCANDRIAIGAIRAANKHGLFAKHSERRNSLRIAGHDDHPLSEYMYPAITTAGQDIKGIGKAAVSVLVNRIGGESSDSSITIFKDAALRIREST